jgi:hypothetical protein
LLGDRICSDIGAFAESGRERALRASRPGCSATFFFVQPLRQTENIMAANFRIARRIRGRKRSLAAKRAKKIAPLGLRVIKSYRDLQLQLEHLLDSAGDPFEPLV